MSEPTVTFRTRAPEGAPDEIKGRRCYFRPEFLVWTVTPTRIQVEAHGPATRVEYRMGSAAWYVEGVWGDERPSWLLLPVEALSVATRAVRGIGVAIGGDEA